MFTLGSLLSLWQSLSYTCPEEMPSYRKRHECFLLRLPLNVFATMLYDISLSRSLWKAELQHLQLIDKLVARLDEERPDDTNSSQKGDTSCSG